MKNRSVNSVVPKGTNILKSLPFAYVLKSSLLQERCDDCFAKYITHGIFIIMIGNIYFKDFTTSKDFIDVEIGPFFFYHYTISVQFQNITSVSMKGYGWLV